MDTLMSNYFAGDMYSKRKSRSDSEKELLNELNKFLLDSPTILSSSSPVKKKKYNDGIPDESLDFMNKTSMELLDMSLDDTAGSSLLQTNQNLEDDVLNVSSKTTLELLDMSLEEPVGSTLQVEQYSTHDTSNGSGKTTLELLDMSLEESVCSSQLEEILPQNSFETVVKKCINNIENIFVTKNEVNINTGISSATPSESSGNPGTKNHSTTNWCLIM